MNKLKIFAIKGIFILTGLAFAAAGTAKLFGVPALHASFASMGLPVWFGYLIGVLEVAGAIGLYIRKTSILAGSGLSLIMLGAIYFHINYEVASHGLAALILLVFLIVIILTRRGESDHLTTQ